MTISLIWAEALGGVIGARGDIPWRIPGEQLRFKELTMGTIVVMGRITWDSLPSRWRPLPGRTNVVLTRDPAWVAAGAEVVTSVQQILERYSEKDLWVMGGAAIYEAFLPHATFIMRTEIDLAVDGDTYAPKLGPGWSTEEEEWQRFPNQPPYRFVTHRRS